MKSSETVISNILQELNQQLLLTLPEKVAWVSQHFLGAGYIAGALGEGPLAPFDQNPLFRTDAFDCLTFVNTVLAIVFSSSFSDFELNMRKLNYYQREPLYQHRFHFMSTDWNIENARQGFIYDITAEILKQYDGDKPMVARALIDKPNWFLKRSHEDIKQKKALSTQTINQRVKALHDFAHQVRAQYGEVNYIPLTKLFNDQGSPNLSLFACIPSGAIIEIVRPDWPLRDKIGTNLNVSHLGFALRADGSLFFRNASSLQQRVVDEPLILYLKEKGLSSPTIQGINVHAVGSQTGGL